MKQHRLFFFVLVMLLILPLRAQDEPRELDVSFEGVGLTYSTDIAENVAITLYHGDPVESAGPGFSDAAHFTFQFYDIPFPELMSLPFAGNIRIYRVSDLAQYDFMQAVVDDLSALLEETPELSSYSELNTPLPYLPILTHGQVIRAQAHYLTGEQIQGISYVAVVQAAAEPFLNNSFFYTFQGLSLDGQYYISADFPLVVNDFPTDFPENFDMTAFVDNLDEYLTDSMDVLNNLEDSEFMPGLTTLDTLLLSMTFPES